MELVEKCGAILTDTPGRVGSGSWEGGGNSGFQALNLVVQFGARKIVLVGFDMNLDRGVHWHGRHDDRLLNNPHPPAIAAWRRALDQQASRLEALGVQVINTSAQSALTAYAKMSLREALAC